MEKAKTQKIMDGVYLFNDTDGDACYLVLGSEKALLIDTMSGHVDVKALVESITDLPLVVVNTHGHFDHIGGNYFVKEAYMNPVDLPLAKAQMKMITDSDDYKQHGNPPFAAWKNMVPGDTLDIGGNVLEVYGMAGHTKGCICLLDRKHRILFSGDGVIPHIWMQLEVSLTLPELLHNLNALDSIAGEYDLILTGHSKGLEDPKLMEKLKRGVQEVIDGKTENDQPYEYFWGVATAHPYDPEDPNKQVVYNR